MAATTESTSPTRILALDRSPDEQSARARIERLFSIFVGAGYLGYIFLLGPSISAQWSLTATWWNVCAVALVFIPPIVMFVAALRNRMRLAKWATVATAVGFVIAAVSWGLTWNGDRLQDQEALWLSVIPGMAALAAAIALPRRWVLTILAAAVIPVQIYLALVRPDYFEHSLIAGLAFAFLFILLYVAAAMMAMRTGRVLDETRADAYASAAAAAEADARRAQRSHVDALLHDWVMSTLLAAARQGNTETVRKQAVTTLEKLDSPPPDVTVVSPATASARLRSAALTVDVTTPVSVYVTDGATGTRIPIEVVDVFDAAIAEALRNSLKYAGGDAHRHVSVVIDDDTILADISDDGTGFDQSMIPPHRLGVAVSILARVRSLPGGSAELITAPGRGTRVRLSWQLAS